MRPGDLWLFAVVTLLLGEVTELAPLLLLPRGALDLLRTDISPESFLPSTFLLDLLRKGKKWSKNIWVHIHFYEAKSSVPFTHLFEKCFECVLYDRILSIRATEMKSKKYSLPCDTVWGKFSYDPRASVRFCRGTFQITGNVGARGCRGRLIGMFCKGLRKYCYLTFYYNVVKDCGFFLLNLSLQCRWNALVLRIDFQTISERANRWKCGWDRTCPSWIVNGPGWWIDGDALDNFLLFT